MTLLALSKISKRRYFAFAAMFSGLAIALFGISRLRLVENGLDYAPSLGKVIRPSQRSETPPEIFSSRIKIFATTTWGALVNDRGLSQAEVVSSYACTTKQKVRPDFNLIKDTPLVSGANIRLVYGPNGCN